MKINRIAILLVLGLVNITKVSINGLYAPHREGTYPNFRQRPMSYIAYYNQ